MGLFVQKKKKKKPGACATERGVHVINLSLISLKDMSCLIGIIG